MTADAKRNTADGRAVTTDRLDAAAEAVDEERARVRAEREAVDAFHRRVAGLSTATVRTSPPAMLDPHGSPQSAARVRTAYVETVMAVPHYETAYGDTVAESLAIEFGDDVAAAIVGETALTPTVRDAVCAAAEAARGEREAFLDVLGREADSLSTAAADIADVRASLRGLDDGRLTDRGFDDLRNLWGRANDLEARTEAISLRRQETIRGYRSDLPGVPTDLTEYLYADMPASYPVLAAVADLNVAVRRATERVERALTGTA